MFPKFLKKKYIVVSVIVLLAAGTAIWFFWSAPVMSVEGKQVSTGEFLKIKSAISHFNSVSRASATSTLPAELNRQVLGNLIEIMLVNKMVAETDPTINQRAEDLVRQVVADNASFSVSEAANRLYGLSEKDFTDLVLIPQAKRNLLLAHFKDDQAKLNDLWDTTNKIANIKIYYPGFYWADGEVKTK